MYVYLFAYVASSAPNAQRVYTIYEWRTYHISHSIELTQMQPTDRQYAKSEIVVVVDTVAISGVNANEFVRK